MYSLVSRVFLAFLVMAYSIFLIALAWWAVSGRLRFPLKKYIGLALVRPLSTFRMLWWQAKGLKSATSPRSRSTDALPGTRSFGRRT